MSNPFLTLLVATLFAAVVALLLLRYHQRVSASAPRREPVAVSPNAGPQGFDPNATRIFRHTASAPSFAPEGAAQGLAPVETGFPRLVGLTGAHKGRSFPIHAQGVYLGRSPTCDIHLSDQRVSGRHAWIGLVDGKIVLRDLKSTNGTFVNANMKTAVHEMALRPGDTVFLGGHLGDQFHFRNQP